MRGCTCAGPALCPWCTALARRAGVLAPAEALQQQRLYWCQRRASMFLRVTGQTCPNDIGKRMRATTGKRRDVVLRQAALAPFTAVGTPLTCSSP